MVAMKPESALRRADELIGVGKQQRALETLFEVITSRRHRTWTKTHEPLMEKFLDLCVELKKSQLAKDGLYQYKTISQSVALKSLEDVILRYLRKGEERCSQARQAATNALVDIDDLEVIQRPESLLLSAVSGESQQDRTDRDMLAPWLKFLWESYKQCLDLLKNNSRVQKIYQDVAQMGFRFCETYNRRPEFRKLCDTIRSHFAQSQKYAQQNYSINIHSPDTQALLLETRLTQLNTAITMELWQEAYKAVEDIHTFTTISKKQPRPQQLADYYNKLALVFWKAGNYIFHATTVLKLYVLHKEQKKNITHAELCRLSSKALLSILSISLPTPRTQIDEHLETEANINEKQKRLTSLLGLQQIPTRANLIRDMIKQGVLNFVYPELKNMYEWLEVEFNPLKISNKMEESIEFVDKLAQQEYSQYISALREVTVVRLLQQISQVYQTIELKRLVELAPTIDKHRLEKLIVNAAKNGDVQVRIEHKSKALTFGTDLNLSTNNETNTTGNVIQKMPNEQIRAQLTSMSRALYGAMDVINEKFNRERSEKLRREIAATYIREQMNQRRDILKRRDLIERYKEELEKKSNEEMRRKEMAYRQQKDEIEKANQTQVEADKKQQAIDAALEREKQEHRLNMQIAIDKLRESEIGIRIIKHVGEEELYGYDPDSLNTLHIDAVIKHIKEQKEKLKSQYKKFDYLIRAQHEAEIPLIERQSEEEIRRRREIQLIERARAIERREQLIRMDTNKKEFLQSIRGQRHEDFVARLDAFEKRLQIAREQRLQQLRKEHIEKRKQEFRKERAAEKQRREQLKQERILAEKKRQKDLELAEKRAIDSERMKKLNEQAEIQRAKDRAIEEKMNQTTQNTSTSTATTNNRRTGPTHHDKDKTDGQSWKRNVRPNDNNESSRIDTKDIRRDQRPRGNNERRFDEPSGNKSALNEAWKPRPRPEQSNREERRPVVSPTSSERRPESNADKSDNWRTVEKRRQNPPRNENDRPSQQPQQRSGESSSSAGAWRPRSRVPEESRDNIRSGPTSNTSANVGRADDSNNWRSRENRRLNSWRANDSDDENQE